MGDSTEIPMKSLLACLAACLVCGTAAAHTALTDSTPAAGDEVRTPVAEVALAFNAAVRLTAVIVADADGNRHEIEAAPQEPAARFALDLLEPLPAGRYVLSWRAVGADTHIVSGDVPFTVVTP
jgi:methionine-rich copper-binding protein CopC